MAYKTVLVSIFLLFINLTGFGQAKTDTFNSKNYIGFEFSLLVNEYSIGTKLNENLKFGQPNSKLNLNITLKYKRVINEYFDISILGSYLRNKRKLETHFNYRNYPEYNYSNFAGDFNHNQFYILIMQGIGVGKGIRFYAKAGFGICLNYFSNFENTYEIVSGLDGKFQRIKLLPDLTQYRLSTKLAIDFGTQSTVTQFATINTGMRLQKNFPVQLKNKNIYLEGYNMEIYLGVMFTL